MLFQVIRTVAAGFPRFNIQPIAVPAAMPAANVIAALSNGCRSKRLLAL